jgi:prevent-host-death family protein
MPLKKIPFTDARETLSSLIDEVQKLGQPIAITRHGKPVAVLMNMDAIEHKVQKLEKQPWMLRGSGSWVGDPGEIDSAIREIRRQFNSSEKKRISKLLRDLSGK